MFSPEVLSNLIIFVPTIFAVCLIFADKAAVEFMRVWTLVGTAITFALTVALLGTYTPGDGGIQQVVAKEWISSWNIYYRIGYDGISLTLVVLTGFVFLVSMLASWGIEKHVKGYLILFLVLETGVMGVFFALDFFLFYVFWEVMLLPMYFLLVIWGKLNLLFLD